MSVASAASACPICAGHERVDYYDRPLATCTGCGSLERQRAVVRTLGAELVPRGDASCLEVAPLNARVFGGFLRALGWEYEAVDKRLLREARDPGGFDDFIDHDRDIADLHGIASGRFELVILQHVFAEVADDRAAMDEIARVLAPGGRALLEIPWKPELAHTQRIDRERDRYGNRRDYGRDLLEDLLARFSDVEPVELIEGMYLGTVFVCRSRAGSVRRHSPLGVGRVRPGAPLRPIAIDAIATPVTVNDPSWTGLSLAPAVSRGAGARDAVDLADFPVLGDDGPVAGHLALRGRYSSYSVRRIFMMSVPRCSLAGPHMVVVHDDRVVEETMRGVKSFGSASAFDRSGEGWPAIARNATQTAIEEPVVAVGAKAAQGYFHWITEVVLRLLAVRGRGDLRRLPVLLRPAPAAFQQETLDWFDAEHRFVAEDVVHVQRAVVPSFPIHPDRGGRYGPEVVTLARELLDLIPDARRDDLPKRIYVTRRDARSRKIANEPALEEALAGLGVQTVTLTGMPVSEQIAMFAAAELVVGPHGGGLTNILFARPGTRVVELYPATFMAPSPYWTIASLAGLDYAMVLCDPTGPVPKADPHNADVVADVDRVTAALTAIRHP